MSGKYYFAYGSNINLKQMALRCPNARLIGPVTLNGYRLAFRSPSGVATIIPHGSKRVKGILWELTPQCEKALDLHESRYYKDEKITVMDKQGKKYTAMAYIMACEFERDPHYPTPDYYYRIHDGYKQNKLPLKYLHNAVDDCVQEVKAKQEHDYRKQFRMNFSVYHPPKTKKRKGPER